MLSDAAIERYSRQILLPEVGGWGQERLGAARVTVAGDGAIAAVARDLLARAGVSAANQAAPADVRVDLTEHAAAAHAGGAALVVGTGSTVDGWPTLPCDACARPAAPHTAPGGALAVPAALALGALVAAETLVILLGIRTSGRRQTVDLAAGTLTGAPLAPRPGCAVCTSAA